ncbi:MAG TPA: hypothetical protein VHX43_17865 [Xanthobacteraceae bacterium]|nr:hypothetical protein [Xanthobacteraceae bacterium]
MFGDPAEARRLCDGQWLIFPENIVCMAAIGAAPNASHFEGASRFCWVADQPFWVDDQGAPYFVPSQVVGSSEPRLPIQLFVRVPHAQQYLYAGQLSPSHAQRSPGRENYGMAWFDLKPPIPSSVWERLGLRLGNLNFVGVDQALDRLRGPTTVHDRLGALQELVNFWHAPIRPEDGMSDAEIGGVALPLPLRWWYRWAGKRNEVMSGQNFLFVPRDYRHKYRILAVMDGRLHFYVENQGVYQWATLPNGDDPPVFGRYEYRGRWVREQTTLSEHLILACLFEAVMCHANYGASAAWLEEEKFAAITRRIPPLAVPQWRWLETRFFAGQGAFMFAAENGHGRPYGKNRNRGTAKRYYSVHIGAKTDAPLQFLKPLIDDRWGYVAL